MPVSAFLVSLAIDLTAGDLAAGYAGQHWCMRSGVRTWQVNVTQYGEQSRPEPKQHHIHRMGHGFSMVLW